jgi:hypothetical protein
MTPSIPIRYIRTRGAWRRELAGLWSDTVLALENTGRAFLRYGPMLSRNLVGAGLFVFVAFGALAVLA